MTERQLKLKDEIIKISDILQLGIDKDDNDYFNKFIKRMDVSTKIDSISSTNGWLKLSESFTKVSYDFLTEFKNKSSIYTLYLFHKNTPIDYGLHPENPYLCQDYYYKVMELAKDKRLTNEMVVKYEKLFDQTFGRCGSNAVPYIKETAWKYILENKSLKLEDRFYDKPISNIDKDGRYIDKYKKISPFNNKILKPIKTCLEKFIYGDIKISNSY